LYSHKSPSTPPVKVWVTVLPVDTFSITAVPAVLLVAVTVTVTIVESAFAQQEE
jgi:hypothetical protein